MRRLKVSSKQMQSAITNTLGKSLVITFHVDWPELQLTENQIMANVLARCDGREIPYLEPYVTVELERPPNAKGV